MSAFSNYYTCADVNAFIEHPSGAESIMLDKMKTIGFSESLTSSPVYGIGNSHNGFKNTGNVIVQGFMELNFIHPDYLKKAIEAVVSTSQKVYSEQQLAEHFNTASPEDLAEIVKIQKRSQNQNSGTGIETYPENFNLRIVFNNGNLYHGDTPKTFLIKGVKIVGSQLASSTTMDGAVSITYKFLATNIT